MIPLAVESAIASWAAKGLGDDEALVARETFVGCWMVDIVSRCLARKLAMAAEVSRIPKRLRSPAPAGHAWLVYFENEGAVGLALVETSQAAKGEAIAVNAWGGCA